MSVSLPDPLRSLLDATDPGARDEAWRAFLAAYSDLILRAARSLGGEIDDHMDRYAFAIGQLRREDCQRLRRYVADGRAQFTTWLVLVVRRLCLDEHRRRHGRLQAANEEARAQHEMRRRLAALLGGDLDLESLPGSAAGPDDALRATELNLTLDRALASLDPRDRLLLRLRFEDDESVPTIARLLRATSAGHVYRRLDALLIELRARLTAAGVTDSRP